MPRATSITAPSAEIRTPHTSRPLTFSPSSAPYRIRFSASCILKPFIGERVPATAAAIPAARTPPTQPQTAQNVFFEYPFKKISPAAADTADTAMVTGIAGTPRSRQGIRINQIQPRVSRSPARAPSPFFPPSAASRIKKTSRKPPRTIPLS